MSPEERQLITSLFDRINSAATAPRDAEAEALIADGVKRAPHAPYVMAQAVIVQEEALKAASSRIEALEAKVKDLEEAKAAQPASTSFLGGIGGSLFGGNRTGSGVPAVSANAATNTAAPAGGSVWNRGAPVQPQQGFQQQPAYQQPMQAPMQAAQPAGSGFLGNALATAAGVAGGALLFQGLQSAFGNHHSSIFGNMNPSNAGFIQSETNYIPTPVERPAFLDQASQQQNMFQEASYDPSNEAGAFDSASFDNGSFDAGNDDSSWA
jgi:hypothetical protein